MSEQGFIAEFMGFKPRIFRSKMGEYYTISGMMWGSWELRYDREWSWLMPVVERIESYAHAMVEIRGTSCYIHHYALPESIMLQCDTKLESVFLAVSAFVNWYNIKIGGQNG